MTQSLNLEFWDKLKEKYPHAMKDFSEWIDQYKRDVNWNWIFNETHSTSANIPKYHDLPDAMQFGIFQEYRFKNKIMSGVVYMDAASFGEYVTKMIDFYLSIMQTRIVGEQMVKSEHYSRYPTQL